MVRIVNGVVIPDGAPPPAGPQPLGAPAPAPASLSAAASRVSSYLSSNQLPGWAVIMGVLVAYLLFGFLGFFVAGAAGAYYYFAHTEAGRRTFSDAMRTAQRGAAGGHQQDRQGGRGYRSLRDLPPVPRPGGG
eukprot:m51a1_g4019 hypothetical protein (133) ;mRNA; f:581715-582332